MNNYRDGIITHPYLVCQYRYLYYFVSNTPLNDTPTSNVIDKVVVR